MEDLTAIPSRLLSLDVFRGITIVSMILVNSPGNQTAYAWLNHSSWNGCTLADLVFPFFIFVLGVSCVFSLSKACLQGLAFPKVLIGIIRRSTVIFAIGLFLNAFPYHFDFSSLRIFGVLQRIAICYFFAALLFVTTKIRTQAFIALVLLLGYWLIMTLIPVPGYGVNNLTQEGNLAGYIDRLIFSSSHLYGKIFDPEGILSTLPAIATALIGNLTGAWLLTLNNKQKKLNGIIIAGVLSTIVGMLWGLWFPINKNMWTSSFVLLTAGLALILLGICYWLIEIKAWRKWTKPFEIFGMNAIAAYFFHIFFLKIQAMVHLSRLDNSPGNFRIFIAEHAFSWVNLQNASLLYAFSYVVFWFLVLTIFYRKNIFIKI